MLNRPYVRAAVVAALTLFSTSVVSVGADARSRCGAVDYNQAILDLIREMPVGGGYELDPAKVDLPKIGARRVDADWQMTVENGFPSHCTSAAYTVWARLVARLQNAGRLGLSGAEIRALAAEKTAADGTPMPDGHGPFWIFNSNGAGAAALFWRTGIGINFRDDELDYARPGDFMKVFWNANVGVARAPDGRIHARRSESGHQTIYTGTVKRNGQTLVCFWGSQKQGMKRRGGRREARYLAARPSGRIAEGYGEVCRPRADIKHMIFSRLTCLGNLPTGLRQMAAEVTRQRNARVAGAYHFVDARLAALHHRAGSHEELDRAYDIQPAAKRFDGQ